MVTKCSVVRKLNPFSLRIPWIRSDLPVCKEIKTSRSDKDESNTNVRRPTVQKILSGVPSRRKKCRISSNDSLFHKWG